MKYLVFFGLVFFQSMTFTFISRARNRDNIPLATIASFLSNGVWLLVFRGLVLNLTDGYMYVVYILAMTSGTLLQMKISKRLESIFK